jgi:putative membrane-bound dehydrogenase-like protein
MNLFRFARFIPLMLVGVVSAQSDVPSQTRGRRLEVMFFGAPTANHPGHDPVTRYRVLKKALGVDGIDFTYVEDPAEALKAGTLANYDAVLMYGNWNMNGAMPPDQLQALLQYVDNGGGFLPVHTASASYGGSPEFVKLVGGHFKEHGTGVFKVTNVNPEHPIMKGYGGFETWDETYVHDQQANDRVILEKREQEPWTWVRQQGKGRVFYTAAGHDHRVWDLPEFQDLLKRAILWSVGPEKTKLLDALKLPKLEEQDVLLPGYLKRQAITKAQKPLSPADSIKFAQVPVGFELSLFAAEPDIVNPISVNWDHKGRAFVVQTVDYPNNLQAGNLGHDSIKICEDTNGDGKADKFTVFADKLSIPTSLTFANGGVICTNGSEMLFLQDTDGDDKADVRKVLLDGFGMGDTHAGPSNLVHAPDGWIYATVGYSGFDGVVGGEKHSFSQAVFRFKPDGSKLEVLQSTTNNTWGLGIDSDFDVMGSTANGNPSFYLSFPQADYKAAGLASPRTPRADDNPIFNPSSKDIRQVDQFDKYTAGAGHGFYTSERFPASWRETTAFVTEPTGKLVGTFDITRDGAMVKATQRFNNLFNSADAWTAPVCAETGPDGAVWICDWYNLIIQHNPTPSKGSAGMDAAKGKGNAYESPLRDTQYGRIYRVYPKGTKDDAKPVLDSAKPDALIAALSHPNLFWRLTAQRLLVDSGDKSIAPKLVELATGESKGAPHAVYALASLGTLDAATLNKALASPVRAVLRAGILSATPEQLKAAFVTTGRLDSLPRRELADVLVGLSRSAPDKEVAGALVKLLTRFEKEFPQDSVLRQGWQICANRHAAEFLPIAAREGFGQEEQQKAAVNLLPNPDFSKITDGKPDGWNDLRTYSGASAPDVVLTSSPDGRHGTPCLMMSSDKMTDSGPTVKLKVEKYTHYRLSGWIRTENMVPKAGGPGALMNISGGKRTEGVKGTTDWTEVSMEFDSDDDDEVTVNCLLGAYGGATGKVWFDDVSLVAIGGGGRGIDSMLRTVAQRFISTADPAARQAMAAKLEGQLGAFAKATLETLRQAPSADQANQRKFKIDPAIHARGKEVYAATCVACHQPTGGGMEGAFPPLDGSDWLTGDSSLPIRVVLHGLTGKVNVGGHDFDSLMPGQPLDDQKISDVLTYARQSWSNDAAPVTPAEVKAVREKHADRTAPWTAKELGK